MLQIATGKFSRNVELTSTKHRYVLYTNAVRFGSPTIETAFGNLMPASVGNPAKAWVGESTETLEAVTPSGQKEVLVSTAGTDIAADLAVVLSFVLNLTFTTSEQSLNRLISTQPSDLGGLPSNKFLIRTFDESVHVSDEDVDGLRAFIKKMWLLERGEFRAILNGMRRYVLATHRMKDEPSLAYSLLVMAVESIEQNINNAEVEWVDIEESKRVKVDAALEGCSPDVAKNVRSAICDTEKVKASAKFREFVLSNVSPEYFRSEAQSAIMPPSRLDLKKLLQNAYQVRSQYVHRLKELDNNLRHPHGFAETDWAAGDSHLTFQGLARLVRHVIGQRVRKSAEHTKQQFDYRGDLPCLSVRRLASHYWIHSADGYGTNISRRNLSACLDQIFQCNIEDGAAITDQTEVMRKIENFLPNLTKAEDRGPMVAHYLAYNLSLAEEFRSPKFNETVRIIDERYGDTAYHTLECFSAGAVIKMILYCDLNKAEQYWEMYVAQRHHKNGLKFSQRIEATMLISVAEISHKEGNLDKAKEFVSKAVESYPGQKYLLFLEAEFSKLSRGAANWRDCFFESQRVAKGKGT